MLTASTLSGGYFLIHKRNRFVVRGYFFLGNQSIFVQSLQMSIGKNLLLLGRRKHPEWDGDKYK